jgi:DNA-binding beta-propeller fold protein YncE
VNFADVDNEVTAFAGKPTSSVSAPAWPFADGTGNQATFGGINDMAADNNGNLYVADHGYAVIRKITPSGQVSTFLTPVPHASQSFYIDQDGSLSTAKASNVKHVAVSSNGERVFFATAGSLRLALPDSNRVVSLIEFPDGINGIATNPDGSKVYVSSGKAIYEVTNISC